MSAAKKPRLPRQQRVAPSDRPPLQLTERDQAVIKAVNDHRALLTAQIEALFFGSRSTAQTRLARLFQHEYLDRHFPTLYGDPAGSTQALYTVGKRGAQLLVEAFGYETSDLRLPKRGAFAWKFVEHLLKINDFRVALALGCRLHDYTLETWLDETAFRARRDYVPLTDKRGRPRQKPVLPDGYFLLSTPHGKSRCFLEIDRGTEALAKFAPQIRVYEAYVESGGYQARFEAKSLRVLVVTTTPKRLHSLMRVTTQVGGGTRYCFTTFDQVSPATILSAPIWQRLGSAEPEALIT